MKQGDEGLFVSYPSPATVEFSRRRAIGRDMLKRGATSAEVSAATGSPLRTVRAWRTELACAEAAADAVPSVPPPPVSFAEKNLRELADVPLGAW